MTTAGLEAALWNSLEWWLWSRTDALNLVSVATSAMLPWCRYQLSESDKDTLDYVVSYAKLQSLLITRARRHKPYPVEVSFRRRPFLCSGVTPEKMQRHSSIPLQLNLTLKYSNAESRLQSSLDLLKSRPQKLRTAHLLDSVLLPSSDHVPVQSWLRTFSMWPTWPYYTCLQERKPSQEICTLFTKRTALRGLVL